MSESLFRKEALKSQGENLWGEVILSQPLSYRLLTFFLVGICSATAVFLCLNDYQRKQTVSGILVPDKGVVSVFPPNAGILQELLVAEGEEVREGTELFSLQVDRRRNGAEPYSQNLQDELQRQETILQRKLSLEKQELTLRLALQDDKIGSLIKKRQELKRVHHIHLELENLEDQARLRGGSLIAQGSMSASEGDKLRKRLLEQQMQVGRVQLNLSELEFELAEAERIRASLMIQSRQQESELESRLIEIAGRKARAAVDRRNVVHAPLNGRVTAVLSALGQNLDARTSVLSIIPEGARLQAHLFLPSAAAGFIRRGQKVKLRYAAFPYQKFGVYEGLVEEVSAYVMAGPELPQGLGLNEPVYRVKVALQQENLDLYGRRVYLKPGMKLSADVILDTRSLFEWLFEPLYSLSRA